MWPVWTAFWAPAALAMHGFWLASFLPMRIWQTSRPDAGIAWSVVFREGSNVIHVSRTTRLIAASGRRQAGQLPGTDNIIPFGGGVPRRLGAG